MAIKIRNIVRLVTLPLAALFLLSAALNLGAKIPLGEAALSFSVPSMSIAEFELVIGIVMLVAAALSSLYVYGGALLLAVVGIAEGLLSPGVQGLARDIHETMIPFAIAGWILVLADARASYNATGQHGASQRRQQIVTILQFFVGGLVTLGGAAYARGGVYPLGTILGLIHLCVGLVGLIGGYAFLRRKSWSREFLIAIDIVTAIYSTFSESAAQIYALLPPGINDSLIGTVVAIIACFVILFLLFSNKNKT